MALFLVRTGLGRKTVSKHTFEVLSGTTQSPLFDNEKTGFAVSRSLHKASQSDNAFLTSSCLHIMPERPAAHCLRVIYAMPMPNE